MALVCELLVQAKRNRTVLLLAYVTVVLLGSEDLGFDMI